MTNLEVTPSESILVAIDISKSRNDILIDIPRATRHQCLVVLNTRSEHDRLIERLLAFGRPVIAGFEATGKLPSAARIPTTSSWLCTSAGVLGSSRAGLVRPCTMDGTRTIRKTLRSFCTCSKSEPHRRTVIRSARRQRHPGAVKDARGHLEGEDGALAPTAHTLSAALFSRDCSLRWQLAQRLVPCLPWQFRTRRAS